MIFLWSVLILGLAVLVVAAFVSQHRAQRPELHPAASPFRSRMRRAIAAAEPPAAETDSTRSGRSSFPQRRFRPPLLVSWSVSRVEQPDRSGPEEEEAG